MPAESRKACPPGEDGRCTSLFGGGVGGTGVGRTRARSNDGAWNATPAAGFEPTFADPKSAVLPLDDAGTEADHSPGLGRVEPEATIGHWRSASLGVCALVVVLVAGCGGAGGPSNVLIIELIDSRGRNAAEQVSAGELEVTVIARGASPATARGRVADGTFDLSLPLGDETAPSRILARLVEDGLATRAGALPEVRPAGELPARLVMGPPDSCAELNLRNQAGSGRFELDPPLVELSMISWDEGLALIFGGTADNGKASSSPTFLELMGLSAVDLGADNVRGALGPSVATRLGPRAALFVSDERAALLHGDARLEPFESGAVQVHRGAGRRSALVYAPEHGAALIAGSNTARVTWFDRDGVPDADTELAVARSDPAAAWLAGPGVLVAGGARVGEPVAEWLRPRDRAVPLALEGVPSHRGGWIAPSPDRRSALYAGMRDERGEVQRATWVISACETLCSASPGPDWVHARTDAALARTEAGTTWLIGGASPTGDVLARVETVQWMRGVPSFVPAGPLAMARAGASAVEHASGVVLVAGGRGAGGLLASFELCFPAQLDR